MQIILLEKVEHVGALGQEVRVKDGYARNYLLPTGKALRATDANRAFFQREKAAIEASNATRRDAAASEAKKLEKLNVIIIRQAAEGGHLYGSVSARDIAEAITAETKVAVERKHVVINDSFKTLGLFTVQIALHAEVKVDVTINIARTADEAAIQKKTGKALIRNDREDAQNEQIAAQAEAEYAAATQEAADAAE